MRVSSQHGPPDPLEHAHTRDAIRERLAAGAAASTFVAFLVCGLVPLIPFVLGLGGAFGTAAVATGVVFAAIGAIKSRWSPRPWWRSGLETLVVDGGAAGVAYAIGACFAPSWADRGRGRRPRASPDAWYPAAASMSLRVVGLVFPGAVVPPPSPGAGPRG